ncbi:MAG: glucose-1-phosphate adenylyltransferase subunit GlgD [Ruminococcaceae bacterium]|nr:glucose-1-phosphate adenylyltransferase subunit GlgD [Oscillospiraceae bacterium]
MTAVGLIFSNIHDNNIPELTRQRTIGSVPYGGRYRLIDFALSSMVNSGISKIGIVTHNNYQSLLDHLGNGKDWDLARRAGGIKILPPYISSFENAASNKYYSSRLEALMGTVNFFNRCKEDYVVMSDCDVICNIDLNDVIEQHIKTEADITFVTKLTTPAKHEAVTVASADENGNLVDFYDSKSVDGEHRIYINIMVVKRSYLLNILDIAIGRGYSSFKRDIIQKNIGVENYKIYDYKGCYAHIGSMEGYFDCSMRLLDRNMREQLFGIKNFPVLTKIRNSAPTRYCNGAQVTNSVVAEGCVIEGTVEDSIIFRGVHVGKGAVVKNSVLFQDTYVCPGAQLNCVITDKNVMVKDKRVLSGCENMPFYIGKNRSV